jgi:sucrose-6-phosphate hydrolase SacC (GH32 family)
MHVYEPKFWRFEEKFWMVLADYSQNTRLPTQVLMTYQLVIDFLKTGT